MDRNVTVPTDLKGDGERIFRTVNFSYGNFADVSVRFASTTLAIAA